MKIFRALIIPIATLAGAVVTPVLVMPFTVQIRRAGDIVDGTGYGSAAVIGLFLGALVGYVIRTALDYAIWRESNTEDHNRAA
jgi:H+/gluconate symporter-like permease